MYCAMLLPGRLAQRCVKLAGTRLSLLQRCWSQSQSQSQSQCTLLPGSAAGVRAAAAVLRAGGLVAFPTETVFGLGAHALDAQAVLRVFAAKGRPLCDPLIVHVAPEDQHELRLCLDSLFHFQDTLSPSASSSSSLSASPSLSVASSLPRHVCEQLAKHFWPGPLTIVHRAAPIVPVQVTAGSGCVGLRSPRHPLARQLLRLAAVPVAAPSANRFGHVSPTSAAHVYQDLHSFSSEPVYILEDDNLLEGCSVGIESTVCRVSDCGRRVEILRCGAVTSVQIQQCLQSSLETAEVFVVNQQIFKQPNEIAIAPGQMVKHYAPDMPTALIDSIVASNILSQGNYGFEIEKLLGLPNQSISQAMVIDFAGSCRALSPHCGVYEDLSTSGDASEACKRIFSVLRKSESEETKRFGVTHVLLADANESTAGDVNRGDIELRRAVADRLHRAASGLRLITR